MNLSSTSVGGWPASNLYTYVNRTIYNALPGDLRNNIIDTYVVSSKEQGALSNYTSTDKLYILSPKEIGGTVGNYDTLSKETRQLDYYKNKGVTSSSNRSIVEKKYKGASKEWWLRSTTSYNTTYFYNVTSNGSSDSSSASTSYGVAHAF